MTDPHGDTTVGAPATEQLLPAPPPSPGPPGYSAPLRVPTSKQFQLRVGDPLSLFLIALTVVSLVAAGLLGAELYARNRAEHLLAAVVECVVQDSATVSYGERPLLLQRLTDHYSNISIHTAGNQIRNAKGMTADVHIDDVSHGTTNPTIGALEASITWSADGMKQTIQDAIPLLGGLVTGVQTSPDDGTIELQSQLGSIITKPHVVDDAIGLEVVSLTGLGITLPTEAVQSALDDFFTRLAANYPLALHADSAQVTNDGVVAHFSARDESIDGEQGEGGQGDQVKDPCLENI